MAIRGRLALVGTLLVVGGLASGCRYGFDAQNSLATDDATLNQSITEVHLAETSGAVTVQAGAGSATTVHRTLHYNGTNKPAATTSISGGVLSLNGCGSSCTVDYRVIVPAVAKVDGSTASGDVEITGLASVDVDGASGNLTVGQIAGQVDLNTSSGDIKVSKVGGNLESRSSSGDQNISEVAGTVLAQSQSGNIAANGLRGARAAVHGSSGDLTIGVDVAQDVDTQSASGSITITVPRGAYRVVASTNSGNRQVGLSDDPNGQHSITAKSDSGDLRISTK
jgi:hypothetical protein